MLRVSKELYEDTRLKSNGKPLMRSWKLPLLSISMASSISPDKAQYLYKPQRSVTIAGIDHGVWVAYGLVDNYFGSKETADAYHELNRKAGVQVDPLVTGQIIADEPIRPPREYFFKVFEIRMKQVLRK